MNRFWSIVVMLCALILILPNHVRATTPDRLYLRDGSIIEGAIAAESTDAYRVLIEVPGRWAPMQTNIPINTVRYTIYGDNAKARKALQMDQLISALKLKDRARITMLPTDAFGDEMVKAAKSAHQRIYILAYYITGSRATLISDFYNTLRAKARAGVDVRIIAEFGKATPMPVRNDTKNFSATLAADGIKVGFIQEYRVMHKKLILIDRNKVILGSSNLTAAGVGVSDELNIRIDSEPFARQAEADVARITANAKTARQLFAEK